MAEVHDFGLVVLLVSTGFALAIMASRLSERLRIPSPAIFLVAAALLSDAFPTLGDLSIKTVERIGVVALVVILFDGGARIGLRRLRTAVVPVLTLGVVGTFATAALMALAAHWLLGFSWTTAGLIGAALAPTDPAVMFSVLGRREVGGRTGTILEAESGANDPVGIALMIGMIAFATSTHGTPWTIVREFALEMSIGLVVGLAGAALLLFAIRRMALPNVGLYPLRTLAVAGVVYGGASALHGSGFLAVFVAGILVGDERAPFTDEIERFMTSLASLAEIVVFVALGLTINLTALPGSVWRDGIALAAVLALLVRPVAAGALLLPTHLRAGERLFVMWGGLKGAVPIFLAAFALIAGVHHADALYGIVFVVVLLSVVVQGSTIPLAASLAGVPMRIVRHAPLEYPRRRAGGRGATRKEERPEARLTSGRDG
jgi:potassium/hydrogen antiporter